LRRQRSGQVVKAIQKSGNRMKLVFFLIWLLSTIEKVLSYTAQKFLGAIETNFITYPLTPNVDIYHVVAFVVTSLALLYLNYVYSNSRQYGIIRYSVWAISFFLTGFFTFCIVNNITVMEKLI